MEQVNEQSTAYLTLAFKDKAGALQIPVSATYRIDDAGSRQAVRAPTSISPVAGTVEIKLTPSDNTILNTVGVNDFRIVTVVASYGTDDQLVSEYQYEVLSLPYYP
jgi:hypothetical protein